MTPGSFHNSRQRTKQKRPPSRSSTRGLGDAVNMYTLGDRLSPAKRSRDPADASTRPESPWSPFLAKKPFSASGEPEAASSQHLEHVIPHEVDIPTYLDHQNELERMKKEIASLRAEKDRYIAASQKDASTLRSYIDKQRAYEQQLSAFENLRAENTILKRSNADLSLALEDLNLKVQLMVSETSVGAAEDKEAMIQATAEKQISLARKQRDEAIQRQRAAQEEALALNSRDDERREEIEALKTKLLVSENALATCRAETANLRERIETISAANRSITPSITISAATTSTSSTIDSRTLEAMQLELDEFRALKPTFELLERDCQRIPDLEREIDRLKLDLTMAESKRMNEETLQIQVEASAAVQRQMDEKIKSLTKENVTIKEEMSSWHRTFEKLSAGRSTEDVMAFVSDLQLENQSLLEKVGELEALLKTSALQVTGAQKKVKEMESSFFDLKIEKESLEGVIAQRDAKLQMTSAEIQGYKALLASYKLEADVGGFESQKTAQVVELEQTLVARVEYADKLETEVKELKAEVLQLNKLAKRMSDEKAFLESRVGRGDVDSSRVRVLHFAETPLHVLRKKEQEEREAKLQTQVSTLDEQLKWLQGATSSSSADSAGSGAGPGAGSGVRVDATLHVQQQQELKMLKHKYQEAKVSMDRMKSATEVAIRRYMSSVWNVFGWKVDFEEKNRVKVRYKFWNDTVRASQAILLFEYPSTLGQKGVNDQLEPFTFLETPFSQTIDPALLDILRTPNTLPLFIAKLTITLFEMVAQQSGRH